VRGDVGDKVIEGHPCLNAVGHRETAEDLKRAAGVLD
jgi:hypothetical protein